MYDAVNAITLHRRNRRRNWVKKSREKAVRDGTKDTLPAFSLIQVPSDQGLDEQIPAA